MDIRKRNDEIERKQAEVDRLNRKLELFANKGVTESMGPLEATIHNLNNEIAEKVIDVLGV